MPKESTVVDEDACQILAETQKEANKVASTSMFQKGINLMTQSSSIGISDISDDDYCYLIPIAVIHVFVKI